MVSKIWKGDDLLEGPRTFEAEVLIDMKIKSDGYVNLGPFSASMWARYASHVPDMN
jgi:hypothetical protein